MTAALTFGTSACTKDDPFLPVSPTAVGFTLQTDPICEVSPPVLNFGSVPLGAAVTRTFTIRNIGGGTLTGSLLINCSYYSIVSGGGGYSLAANQARSVVVKFRPSLVGTHECAVDTHSSICRDVLCTGVGTATGPVCDIAPSSLNFGSTPIDVPVTASFIIRNAGVGTLSGRVSIDCPYYEILGGGGTYTLGSLQTRTVTVRFRPTLVGTHQCAIDTGSSICADVLCTGLGISTGPTCRITPPSLDFGSTSLNVAVERSFTIRNVGDGVLTGSISESCPYYEIRSGAGAYSLATGEDHHVTVRFLPTLAGVHQCAVETGTTSCLDVICTGNCAATAPVCELSPLRLDFGSTPLDAAVEKTFAIRNVGGGVLSGFVSENCPYYEVVSGGGAFGLGTGSRRTVTVRFRPTLAGIHQCAIETGTSMCLDVICTGTGSPPICQVTPRTLDFGSTPLGVAVPRSFVVKNIGGGTLVGVVSVSAPYFQVISGAGAYALGPGQERTAVIRFTPTLSGIHQCAVDTGSSTCVDVVCIGRGVATTPECQFVPARLDFGPTPLNHTVERTFRMRNTGGGTLTGTITLSCPYYELVAGAGSYALASGEGLAVTVQFRPTLAGTHQCAVDTGSSTCLDVLCTGAGTASGPVCEITPLTLEFGSVSLGTEVAKTFVIRNVGTGTLTGAISEVCPHYEVSSGAGSYALLTGHTRTVTVRFRPSLTGRHLCAVETGSDTCLDVVCGGTGVTLLP